MQGDLFMYGTGIGTTNYNRLNVTNTGLGGAIHFDSQVAGTNSAANPFLFQSNGVTVMTVNLTNGILNEAVGWYRGYGSPEGVVTAEIGSFYSRRDGGAGTSWYVKESGTGNTGWVAK